MQFNLGLVAVLLAFLSTAQCIDFGTIFGWFKNPFIFRTKEATSTECTIFKNRRKCKFNTKNINLDVDNTIELTVDTGGRKIKCDKKMSKGRKGWYGNCDGDAEDVNFISRVDKDGKENVFGSIQVGSDVCHIGPNINGQEEIQCIPKTAFKPEDDPPDVPKVIPENLRMLASDSKFGFLPSDNQIEGLSVLRGNSRDEGRKLFDDSGSNIDIIVVWTKAAECGAARQTAGCTVSASTENIMRGLIDLAVAETNTAYALSGIMTELRLVHAYRDLDYVEGSGFEQYLDDLTIPNDGKLDSVHSKRALYGADIVHMIVGDENSCGIGWSGTPSSGYMFGVTQYSCATGYFSFGHEIGHNFGMSHDRGTTNTCAATTTFNYGYRNPSAEFRTILAYDCKVGQCDAMPEDGCTRVQRFSNSNAAYTYNGKPIGNARNDNAKQFNNHRARVASFFPAMNCQIDSECNDNNSNTADTCNTVKKVCVFTPIDRTTLTKTPTRAPVQIASPTKQPTNAPIVASNPIATTKVPTSAPIKVPTGAPIKVPTGAPIRPVTKTPTRAPISPPTRTPIRPPTKSPTLPPVLPQTFFMESMKVTGVTSTAWKVITLSKVYVSPVPVCTVKYDQGTSLLPSVVRMQKVESTSFEVILQNPSDVALSARDVHCVVVEEGAWKLPDGRLIESKKYSSTVTDRKTSYVGQTQSYRNRYTSPVVLGQVMSFNDPKWSVFWSRSSSGQNIAPTSTSIITGKHIGEDSRTIRLDETVGYIVIESGHLKSGSMELETGRGPDSFVNYTTRKKLHKFKARFATTPVVAVLCQAAMDDSDGSWAVLTSNPTTTAVGISVDEDQRADAERTHSTEEVNYAVFSSIGAIQLTKV